MEKYFCNLTLLLLALLFLNSCENQTALNLKPGKELYYQNKIDETIASFTKILKKNPNDVETLTWLAQSYLRKGEKNKAEEYSQKVLKLDNENALANLIYGKSILPHYTDPNPENSDLSWTHYLKAIECDSTNPNIWIEIWGESIRRQNIDYWHTSLKKLYETKFLTNAALEYGRWMLRTLPLNSVLLTNGDMDTYPTQALQEVESFRKDVTIVERGLLDLSWSLKFLRDFGNVPLPYSDEEIDAFSEISDDSGNQITVADQILADWIQKVKSREFTRPLVFAPSVAEDFYEKYKDYINYSGSYFLVNSKPVNQFLNMDNIEESLIGISNSDFSGPWISEKDLSPIRTIYTKNIVKNISYSGIIYSKELIKNGQTNKALSTLTWLEEFEKTTELGPSFNEEISRLLNICTN